MLRFLSRFLGIWLLAAALVMAVVDGAKSIAASHLVLTPLSETWAMLAALGEASGAEAVDAARLPWPLDAALPLLFSVPTVAALAVPALLFLVAGRKRRRFSISREYAT